jgi:hypothetical protein
VGHRGCSLYALRHSQPEAPALSRDNAAGHSTVEL